MEAMAAFWRKETKTVCVFGSGKPERKKVDNLRQVHLIFFSFTDCRTKCDMSLGIIDDDFLNQNVLVFVLTC